MEGRNRDIEIAIEKEISKAEMALAVSRTLNYKVSDIEVVYDYLELGERENFKVLVNFTRKSKGYPLFVGLTYVAYSPTENIPFPINDKDIVVGLAKNLNTKIIYFDPEGYDAPCDFLAMPNGDLKKIEVETISENDDEYYDIAGILD
jgi:hypothetical protein